MNSQTLNIFEDVLARIGPVGLWDKQLSGIVDKHANSKGLMNLLTEHTVDYKLLYT